MTDAEVAHMVREAIPFGAAPAEELLPLPDEWQAVALVATIHAIPRRGRWRRLRPAIAALRASDPITYVECLRTIIRESLVLARRLEDAGLL